MVSYLIKSIICSGLLFAVYHFILKREKMLQFNRFYLLAAMAFSLLVPLVTIEMPSQTASQAIIDNPVNHNIVGTMADNAVQRATAQERAALPAYLSWLLYGLVAAVLLMRTGFQMLVILRSKSGRRVVPFETAQLVLTQGDTPVYSFFKFIFIPQEAFENQSVPKEILTHELAHARQMHSLDILFTELLIALWWFNPLLLLYRRAIRLNHEYLADDAVLAGPTGVKEYQLMLLDSLLAQHGTVLASSFNYPVTKKRLAMMTTNINRRIQFAKKVFIALLLPVLALALSEKTYSQQPDSGKAFSPDRKVETAHDGVSEAEMQDFFATIGKNTRAVKNRKGRTDFHIELSPPEENRLYAVYERMSDAQKAQIKAKEISVFRMDIPVKKAPTPEMFENWKRMDLFGIWLNNKHVPNSQLNKYKYSDIAEYDLSKLYGAALKGRGYKYQLDILTNDYFDKTYDERVNNRVIITRIGWFTPKEAPKKGK
ncbi:beta-lactamase regulating signal transducer with metallopeptidase domain [Dyadobacter sp. BE34]|uniref:Beta-lactamase regulating signal transducer with metallopeptidase domain n=1 Tax=Dyadobacter fermentans TaxID=94254 RepID=A0ABU1R2B8_9BACT|nr:MULTISPECIES: M56 family metallopeptidase [Dyadobacter]MDR6807488.1 beta-lactamase regulating signal transducer with metallopeptidase domain [Dyadobacter fermentans]MDR7045229.1 beta-lactamase regulating signal transducer with metallopeptidase domain [Dyadobacter sp. BE242]MDR7199034.1 beta-lactamase regulating signal transducer with metallopeptidase domain [Dyadobacter sp. BE34]MDR7216994.1 beta-lactamase regulating signal transducer with metallopeptidase domain [Dyadobacter sp. BE31]MDR72